MRYALIQSGRVVNVVLWDGEAEWEPGPDFSAIDCRPEVGIGWTHDAGGFHPPVEPADEDPA